MHEQNEKFNKETEIIKKSETKILELKDEIQERASKTDSIKQKKECANLKRDFFKKIIH